MTSTDSNDRLLLAIGDLHGDYYRLLRLLREQELIGEEDTSWSPQAKKVGVVLIGDYVDWRREPLEGPSSDWINGSKNILDLLYSLSQEIESLREQDEEFDSYLYTLLGNHDEMMLEAHKVFNFLPLEKVEAFLDELHQEIPMPVAFEKLGLGNDEIEKVLRFLNWYVQGGRETIVGYEDLVGWKKSMDGELGDFLRNKLRLNVVVNRTLFAHTAPDFDKFWKPVDEIATLPEADYKKAKEAFLWSRRLWGYDYSTGMRVEPFSTEKVEEMLAGFGVDKIIVGHTPLNHQGSPVIAHEGRVINVDQHAFPGSSAWVEHYQPTEENRRQDPLRAKPKAQEEPDGTAVVAALED